MLLEEVEPTHDGFFRETFDKISSSGISLKNSTHMEEYFDLPGLKKNKISRHVNKIIAGTCGNLYKPLIGKLPRYPIPEIHLPEGSGEILLDIGCNWGRWSVAASRKGYTTIGIDPSLNGIIAAREVGRQLKISARYVVADARYLPFASDFFDIVFSYSVLQHFNKENVRLTLKNVVRVLNPGGTCLIQMPNKFGLKQLFNQAKRKFREPEGFEIRYWTLPELKETFTKIIGPTTITVDGFFGLGIQKSDIDLLPLRYRFVVYSSEFLRKLSKKVGWIKYFADSVYVKSMLEEKMRTAI
jgi:SAM-dependent methyltransferase